MAATFRSAASDAKLFNTGNCVVTKPSGVVNGDLLIAFTSEDDSAGSLIGDLGPPDASWTEIGVQSLLNSGHVKIYQKIADSEPASYTFPKRTGADGVAGILAYQVGTFSTDTPLASGPTFATGSTSTSHVAPSMTGVVSGELVCMFFGGTNSAAARTHSTPAGMTERFDANPGASGWICMSADTLALASTSATGTKTSTCSTSTPFITASIVVKPLLSVSQSVTDTLTVDISDTASLVVAVNKSVTDTLTVDIADSAAREVTFGPTLGTWLAPTVALPESPIAGSVFFWDATVPTGASLTFETSTDNGASWQLATNHGPVERLPIGSDSVKAVMVRGTWMRTDAALVVSPKLHRLELRIAIDGSIDEYCQLGRFFLDDTEVVDNGSGLVLRLTGSDLSRRVAMNTWDKTLVIDEGTNFADAIKTIILDRWPEATFALASTELTTGRLFYGEGVGSGNPWADALALARDCGWELYLDAYGVVCSRPVPDPDLMPAVWTVTDSARPTMIDLSRRMTNENTYNQVIVSGESSSNDVPVRAVWQDNDPTSRTYFGGRYGKVTKTIRSDRVKSTEQAQFVADAEGLRVKGATEIVRINMLPAPFLEPSDVIEADRTYSKTTGRFAVDGWSIPMGPEALMAMTVRRQRQ